MRQTKFTLALLISLLLNHVTAYADIDYEELRGGKKYDRIRGRWELGWGDIEFSDLKDIESVFYIDYKQQEFKGKRALAVVDGSDGIPCPRLHILGDILVKDRAKGDFRATYYGDDGGIAERIWRRELKTREEWTFAPANEYTESSLFLDSTELDTDGDGSWKAKNVCMMDSYRLPAVIDWQIVVPATYFDIKARVSSEKNNVLSFQYDAVEGENMELRYSQYRRTFDGSGKAAVHTAEIRLYLDYLRDDGSCRIGFVNWFTHLGRKIYIVQANDNKGRIIGHIEDSAYADRLAVVEGSLRMKDGKAKKTVTDKDAPIIYFESAGGGGQGTTYRSGEDFVCYEMSRLYNTVHMWFRRWARAGDFAWDDAYVDRRREKALAIIQKMLDAGHKYGLSLEAITAHFDEMLPASRLLTPQYRAEEFDPKTGEFVACDRFDVCNDDAVAYMVGMIKNFYKGMRGLDYCLLSEGNFKYAGIYHKGPFYSPVALEKYREYIGEPEAKFPVDPNWPDTERTYNNPTQEDWEKYFKWKKKIWVEGYILTVFKAMSEVFEDDPYYKGGSCKPVLGEIERPEVMDPIISSPYFAYFRSCFLYTHLSSDCWRWWELSRRYKKKIIPFYGYWRHADKFHPAFGREYGDPGRMALAYLWPSELAMVFEDQLKFAADGIGIEGVGGPGNVEVWKALTKKYYDYGDELTLEEAEQILKKVHQDKRLNYDDAGAKTARIYRTRRPINVDGNLGEWENWPQEQVIDKKEQIRYFGPKKEWNKEDLSARFSLAYDERNIYLAVEVKDDFPLLDKNLYYRAGGGIGMDQIDWMVGFADPYKKRLLSWPPVNAFHFHCLPGQGYVSSFLRENYRSGPAVLGSRCRYRMNEDRKGYTFEASLPFWRFEYKPESGDLIVFDLSVHDADDPSGRRIWSTWNADNKYWRTPARWGLARFE